jgi:hypothetical protein
MERMEKMGKTGQIARMFSSHIPVPMEAASAIA